MFSTNESPGCSFGTATRKKLKLARSRKKRDKTNKHLVAVSKQILQTHLKVGTFAEVLDELHRKKLGQLFVRKSRENYLEAIKLALALYYSVQNEPAALQGLAAEANYRVTKRTDAAQIAVRVIIDYGRTDEERRTNRQFASRDALALKHLAKQGIAPDQVVELGKRIGQGLEAWGRTNRRQRSETKRLDSSVNVTRLVKSAGKVQRCAIGRVAVADDAMTFLKRFQKEGPIWFRENGVDGAVWALVAVKLSKTNPKTQPTKTRRLLSIGLADYLKKLKIMATDKALDKDDCRR